MMRSYGLMNPVRVRDWHRSVSTDPLFLPTRNSPISGEAGWLMLIQVIGMEQSSLKTHRRGFV